MDYGLIAQLIVIVGGFIATISSCVWWLGSQFRQTRDLIYKIKDDILTKLDYHEAHDDKRFQEAKADVQNVRDDVWAIRLRNAAIDGLKLRDNNGSIRNSKSSGEL